MWFRVRRDGFTWEGRKYSQGELVHIDENHPRIQVLIEQSHILEYANCDTPVEPQGVLISGVPSGQYRMDL